MRILRLWGKISGLLTGQYKANHGFFRSENLVLKLNNNLTTTNKLALMPDRERPNPNSFQMKDLGEIEIIDEITGETGSTQIHPGKSGAKAREFQLTIVC